MVLDEITEHGVLLIVDRGIEGNSILGRFQSDMDLFHLGSQLRAISSGVGSRLSMR